MTTNFSAARKGDRPLPILVAAADWSVDNNNRRMAVARRMDDARSYIMDALPAPVKSPETLLSELQDLSSGGSILLGFDFPIGLPRAYAQAAAIRSFREALELFGTSGPWVRFFTPTDEPKLHQPFAPASSRVGFGRLDLARAIGLKSDAELLRRCERKTPSRYHAESVFFLRFAKQVGRSAIQGWSEVIVPNRKSIQIWPFDGTLEDLLSRPGVTIAEIYPAESAAQLSLPLGPGTGHSKRRQSDRAATSQTLLAKCEEAGVMLSPNLREYIASGCGSEHDFDALVATVGMIRTLRRLTPATPPDEPVVHTTEGWILGQDSAEYARPEAPRAHIISRASDPSRAPYFIHTITFGPFAKPNSVELAYPLKSGKGALNVICGLNNSGKSLLLDQIYRVVKGKNNRGSLRVDPLPAGQPRVLFLGQTWTDKDKIGIINLDQKEAALTVGGEHGDYLRCGLKFLLAQMAPYLTDIRSGELAERVLDSSVRKQIQDAFEVDKEVYRCRAEDPLVQRLERLFEARLYFHCFKRKPQASAWQFEFVLAYEDGTTLPYSMWSDGQRACFYILVSLVYFRPEIVLFDELENHLHPGYISEVLEMLNGFPAQSVIATHHPHLIFSRFADRVFYIETKRPRPHAFPPQQVPFSTKYVDFERSVPELRDDFARITAAYRLFKDQDDQLLRQTHYVKARATLILVEAISRLFHYPAVGESAGKFPDTQTQQLADRIRSFAKMSGKRRAEILDLGAGVGRQVAELDKLSEWQLGAEVHWTCYEPIEANRRTLSKTFGGSSSVSVIENVSMLHGKKFDLCVIANVLHEVTPPEFAEFVFLASECVDHNKGGIVILELFPLLHPEGHAVPYDATTLQRILDQSEFSVDVAQISLRQAGVEAYCLLARRRQSCTADAIQQAVEKAWEEILATSLSAYALQLSPSDLSGYQSLLSHLATIASIASWKAHKWLPTWSPES